MLCVATGPSLVLFSSSIHISLCLFYCMLACQYSTLKPAFSDHPWCRQNWSHEARHILWESKLFVRPVLVNFMFLVLRPHWFVRFSGKRNKNCAVCAQYRCTWHVHIQRDVPCTKSRGAKHVARWHTFVVVVVLLYNVSCVDCCAAQGLHVVICPDSSLCWLYLGWLMHPGTLIHLLILVLWECFALVLRSICIWCNYVLVFFLSFCFVFALLHWLCQKFGQETQNFRGLALPQHWSLRTGDLSVQSFWCVFVYECGSYQCCQSLRLTMDRLRSAVIDMFPR